MENSITEQVKTFIETNFLFWEGTSSLGETDSFLGNGIIDSAGILELITFLETTFGITIQDAEVLPRNLDSLQAVTAFVQRKLEVSTSP